jgi:hypothetical protein
MHLKSLCVTTAYTSEKLTIALRLGYNKYGMRIGFCHTSAGRSRPSLYSLLIYAQSEEFSSSLYYGLPGQPRAMASREDHLTDFGPATTGA